MEKQILKVSGMSCGHCKKAVESAIQPLAGVASAIVNLEAGTVEVQFDSSTISLNEIKEIIDNQGYDVQ